ncbi:MAG: response regulator [Candidatus Synoicihabitans palmerolidicus]|nr:response regulator [Candidatus Synoicihabitans palmerolidicus]
MNQKILSAPLHKLGCPHNIAAHGEDALLKLQESPLPDVVLMDCHMPILGRWAATRILRGWGRDPSSTPLQKQAASLPVIALTAASLAEERQRCLDAGMSDFVSKPVQLAQLESALLRAKAPPPPSQ